MGCWQAVLGGRSSAETGSGAASASCGSWSRRVGRWGVRWTLTRLPGVTQGGSPGSRELGAVGQESWVCSNPRSQDRLDQ